MTSDTVKGVKSGVCVIYLLNLGMWYLYYFLKLFSIFIYGQKPLIPATNKCGYHFHTNTMDDQRILLSSLIIRSKLHVITKRLHHHKYTNIEPVENGNITILCA